MLVALSLWVVIFEMISVRSSMDRASVFGTEGVNPQGACGERTCSSDPDGACHSLCQTLAENGPELAAIVTAWPGLSDAIKTGISAMVKASTDRPVLSNAEKEGRND